MHRGPVFCENHNKRKTHGSAPRVGGEGSEKTDGGQAVSHHRRCTTTARAEAEAAVAAPASDAEKVAGSPIWGEPHT